MKQVDPRMNIEKAIRAENQRRGMFAALKAKAEIDQHSCPTCNGQCRCTAPRQYCGHCA